MARCAAVGESRVVRGGMLLTCSLQLSSPRPRRRRRRRDEIELGTRATSELETGAVTRDGRTHTAARGTTTAEHAASPNSDIHSTAKSHDPVRDQRVAAFQARRRASRAGPTGTCALGPSRLRRCEARGSNQASRHIVYSQSSTRPSAASPRHSTTGPCPPCDSMTRSAYTASFSTRLAQPTSAAEG